MQQNWKVISWIYKILYFYHHKHLESNLLHVVYLVGVSTPHRRWTQISDGFYTLWNLLSFQKEQLVWAGRRHWNAINRWVRAFTRAGPAVNDVKGKPVHLIQGLGSGYVSCPTARTEARGSWCPNLCILVSCVMRHTWVLTEILSMWNITRWFLPVLTWYTIYLIPYPSNSKLFFF